MTKMSAKVCVFFVGLVYLFFGIAGLFPSLVDPPPPQSIYYEMTIIGHWGYLFTWLPVNLIHNIVYLIIGGLAIPASLLRPIATFYARIIFFVMVSFVILGFLPFGISYLGGLIPLLDWNIMLHTITAVLLYYFGFIYPLDLGGRELPAELLTLPGSGPA